MIRTRVSLSEEEYRLAKEEAKRLGISLAELLRRSLRAVLPADESKPWMPYAGVVETAIRAPAGRSTKSCMATRADAYVDVGADRVRGSHRGGGKAYRDER
jgi:hypothetical protein